MMRTHLYKMNNRFTHKMCKEREIEIMQAYGERGGERAECRRHMECAKQERDRNNTSAWGHRMRDRE